MSTNPLEIIKQYWGHTGLRPARIVERNQFGNLIVEDKSGKYWRICPEELSCEVIARDIKQMRTLTESVEFKADWEMTGLVMLAYNTLGELGDEQCYSLEKTGDYSSFKIVTIADLIIDSGIASEEKQKALQTQ